MAKKRKTISSDPALTQPPQAPKQLEPEPEPQPEPVQAEEAVEEVEEIEEIEEIEKFEEEVEEEERDSEEGDSEEEGDDDSDEDNQNDNGNNKKKLASGGDDEGAAAEDEPVEKLLEPFSKDQMVMLLKEAVSKYPDLMEYIRNHADADPAHRKIFVHGLGWDTTTETLTSIFGKYGEIEDCRAVMDKVSGKSKGYGFILFKHRNGAQKALKEPQKKIGNRMTSCQLASSGPVPAPPPAGILPASEYTQRKIFVSNVGAELDPQKLLAFFSKFGEIEEGPLGLDKQTGKPRGFCLFVYKSVDSVRKALEEPHKSFEGHTLHCQRAIDGQKPGKNFPQQHFGGPGVQPQRQQQYYGHPTKKGNFSGNAGAGPASAGHLMAPAGGPVVGFNPAVAAVAAAPALSPALGQALTALLATQGAGLGIGNLLGGLGATQGVPPMMSNAGYGAQGAGGYGAQTGMQGGYQTPSMGSQGGVRPMQGGGYMGHGH